MSLACHEPANVSVQDSIQTSHKGSRARQGRNGFATLVELRTRRVARTRRVERR